MSDALDDLCDAARRAFVRGFQGVIKIELDDGAELWVDGRGAQAAIRKSPPAGAKAHCTWRSSRDTMKRVLDGERATESAFISGRLTITGDMSIMARLELEARI